MKPKLSYFSAASLALVLGASGCLFSSSAHAEEHEDAKMSKVTNAVAVLIPTEGNEVRGVVLFMQEGDKVLVKGKVTGLTPGEHGFHVHEFGDITEADGTSAGGHFNPTDAPHAGPDAEKRHVGDLGNITAGDDGVATIDIEDSMLSLSGSKSILGRGLVVHAGKDDLESQPSGDAGARVAVGVIGVMNAEKPSN